jgi:hypothetical protein
MDRRRQADLSVPIRQSSQDADSELDFLVFVPDWLATKTVIDFDGQMAIESPAATIGSRLPSKGTGTVARLSRCPVPQTNAASPRRVHALWRTESPRKPAFSESMRSGIADIRGAPRWSP